MTRGVVRFLGWLAGAAALLKSTNPSLTADQVDR